jgi:hypothetical protein
MVKNVFFLLLMLGLLSVSCRNANDDLQFIDQKVQIFIDSAGKDMLNAKIPNSYTSIILNDVYGTTDIAPIALNLKKTSDTISYIEYLAGAKRIAISTNNYQSKIALQLRKKVGTNTVTTYDTLTLNYTMSPQLFQINNALYNGNLVFTKNPGTENIIKIFK